MSPLLQTISFHHVSFSARFLVLDWLKPTRDLNLSNVINSLPMDIQLLTTAPVHSFKLLAGLVQTNTPTLLILFRNGITYLDTSRLNRSRRWLEKALLKALT